MRSIGCALVSLPQVHCGLCSITVSQHSQRHTPRVPATRHRPIDRVGELLTIDRSRYEVGTFPADFVANSRAACRQAIGLDRKSIGERLQLPCGVAQTHECVVHAPHLVGHCDTGQLVAIELVGCFVSWQAISLRDQNLRYQILGDRVDSARSIGLAGSLD